MQADEPYDEFEIDWTPVWPDEHGLLEPIFFDGPQWIEFPEAEPLEPAMANAALLVEFEEFAFLDPKTDDEPEEPPLPPRQRASAASLAVSFGIHLLTLLVLIGWHSVPAEVAGAIPVRLVIEQASAAPEEMPPGQSVAVSADQAPQAADSAAAPAPPPPARPAQTQTQTQVTKVKPPAMPRPSTPRPTPAATPPRPAAPQHEAKPEPAPPPKTQIAESPPIRAAMAAPPRPTAAASAPPAASIAVRHEGAAAGAAAGDGDYFARLEELTRPYLYMLSPSFLAGRRGQTTLTIVVTDDGTIGRIGIKRSSGYPDIDARIEQMVTAVGRFPPLPPQLRRPGADLDFNLVFPDVLAQ